MKKIIYIAALAIGFASCQSSDEFDVDEIAQGMGGFRLNNLEMQSEGEIPVITTKASDLNTDDFFIRVTNEDNTLDSILGTYLDLKDGNRPMIELPVGKYTATAFNREKSDSVEDDPYFMGMQTFEIYEKRITNIENIKCNYQSIGIEISLTQSFNNLFSDNYVFRIHDFYVNKENINNSFYADDADYASIIYYTVQPKNSAQAYPERPFELSNNGSNPKLGEYYMIEFLGGYADKAATPDRIATIKAIKQ